MIELVTCSYDNCHIMKQELDVLVALDAELKEAFQLWRMELTEEALTWYDEQCKRNSKYIYNNI
jgi:hypothetical protein